MHWKFTGLVEIRYLKWFGLLRPWISQSFWKHLNVLNRILALSMLSMSFWIIRFFTSLIQDLNEKESRMLQKGWRNFTTGILLHQTYWAPTKKRKFRNIFFKQKITVQRNLDGGKDEHHKRWSFQNSVFARQLVVWFRSKGGGTLGLHKCPI